MRLRKVRDTSNIICALMNLVLKAWSHTVSTEIIFFQRMEMQNFFVWSVIKYDENSFKTQKYIMVMVYDFNTA
jgi:hypothetical protein